MTSSSRPDGSTIKVLVVDADRRVRRSLSGLIDLADGLECIAAVGDGPAAVAALDAAGVDVCLLDPGLPELETGISLIAALRERRPGIRIVAMNVSDACEGECLDGGADAFVAKSDQPDELVDVLRSVAASGGSRPILHVSDRGKPGAKVAKQKREKSS